jgi:hypothetical protein
MKFKIINLALVFTSIFLLAYNNTKKEIVLDDLYVVEKNEEFKKLVYTNSFSSYRDSLYTNVVFD